MALAHFEEALRQLPQYTEDNKQEIRSIFRALILFPFSACVSVKYINNTQPYIHDKYVDELRTRVLGTLERVYEDIPCSQYGEYQLKIMDALRKDIDIVAKDAKGDPRTFSHHY